MRDRLLVGTRKGLFAYGRSSTGAWELSWRAFLGDPVPMLLFDERDDTSYAALDLGHFGAKLHRSEDGGATWQEIASPQFPTLEGEAVEAGPAVKLLWSLEPGSKSQPGVLWAGTIPGGLFRSEDRGEHWSLNEALWDAPERKNWFGGGFDEPGIHSISLDPEDANRLSLGVSCGGFWISQDAGISWRPSTKGMFANYVPPERRDDPSIQDPHRIVQCRSAPDTFWVQHHNGIFRSKDRGESWEELNVEPSSFGFAVAVHPRDSDTAWFVPLVKDECRVPVDGQVIVTRTRDGGESFEVLREGLPQRDAYDAVFRHALDVDETGDRLAMGSTTGSLWLSEDGGDSWLTLSNHLPPVYCLRFG